MHAQRMMIQLLLLPLASLTLAALPVKNGLQLPSRRTTTSAPGWTSVPVRPGRTTIPPGSQTGTAPHTRAILRNTELEEQYIRFLQQGFEGATSPPPLQPTHHSSHTVPGEPVFPFGAAPIQTSATLRGDPVKLTLPLFYIIRGWATLSSHNPGPRPQPARLPRELRSCTLPRAF